jgi:V8-like Glu-specific endopeptidase
MLRKVIALLAGVLVLAASAAWAGEEPQAVWHGFGEFQASRSFEEIESRAEPMEAVVELAATSAAHCPPSTYRYWVNTDNEQYPQRTVGRLFFGLSDGRAGFCSGALIRPGVVLTAGHCVHPGQWVAWAYFVPGYLDGWAPHGRFYASDAVVVSSWAQLQDWRYDYGFVILHEQPGNDLGWVGVAWGQDAGALTWQQHGYPAEAPFDGASLVVNESALGGRLGAFGYPAPVVVGSALTPGASGGPWLLAAAEGYYANGVNSGRLAACSEAVMSPYFDYTFGTLYWMIREAVE